MREREREIKRERERERKREREREKERERESSFLDTLAPAACVPASRQSFIALAIAVRPFRCPSRDSTNYVVDFYEIFFGDTSSFSSPHPPSSDYVCIARRLMAKGELPLL